jgi:DNA-binding MarR family transcriptional regulator
MREIGMIARCFQTISDIEFREIQLEKGQYILVVRICENPGISQEELSNMIKVDRTTVAKAIKKLVEKNYIEKISNENDRRAWKLYPTKKALEVYGFLQEEERYTTKTALNGFEDNEKTFIFDLLKRMRVNIEEDWKLVKNGEQRSYLKDKRKDK